MKLALVLCSIDPAIGGVLARGDKGSAKTTLARGLAGLLASDAPFVELPLGATEDRLIGSIDLSAALGGDGVHFKPGLLAGAHGGVLYVDEVNLLADHLVDVLLDVAASGVNQIEREGISHRHPARFVLVGSMNPEEGDLRPQLLDRFGLSVEVSTTLTPEERAEAVRRRLAFDTDPQGFIDRWADEEEILRRKIAAAAPAAVDDDLLQRISMLCVSMGVQGLRADIVIARAASALGGWEGREAASWEDVCRVAPLALAHRQRHSPFVPYGVDGDQLKAALDEVGESAPSSKPMGGPNDSPAPGSDTSPSDDVSASDESWPLGSAQGVVHLSSDRLSHEIRSGRRSKALGDRGRLVGDRKPDAPITSVAVVPTLREAVRRNAMDHDPSTPLRIESVDLRQAVREQRTANLVILALDTSGSMGVDRRMEAASGAVAGVLVDAYQRRDRIGVVGFRGEGAEVLCRPTSSIEVARARLARVSTGGKTPMAQGINLALELALADLSDMNPLLILISDGRATAGPEGMEPFEAALRSAEAVRRRGITSVVVDAEDGPTRLGMSGEIAKAMGARLMSVDQFSPTTMKDLLSK